MDTHERQILIDALKNHNGNQVHTAKTLGLSRQGLIKKMKRLGIDAAEMRESAKIVRQAIAELPDGPISADNRDYVLPPKDRVYDSMEELIHHFMLITEGAKPPAGEVYAAIEAPKGELGFYMVSDGSAHPYRCKIRSPSFNNLQIMRTMLEGAMIADAVATIASLDPVMGECDR